MQAPKESTPEDAESRYENQWFASIKILLHTITHSLSDMCMDHGWCQAHKPHLGLSLRQTRSFGTGL